MVKKIATGIISLIDLNDAIISGEQPHNPEDGQLWIDSSVEPNKLYSWNKTNWIEQTLSISALDPNFHQDVVSLKKFADVVADDGILSNGEKLNIKLMLVEVTSDTLTGDTLPTIATIDSNKGGQVYTVRAEARAAGISTSHGDYKAYETAYTELKTYLDALSPKAWKTGDTVIDPAAWTSKWDAYYDKLSQLQLTTSTYLANSIKPGANYNGVTINTDKGIVVLRGDNLFRTIMNATDGISIEKYENGSWKKAFYTHTDGKIYAKGLVISGDSTVDGTVLSSVASDAASAKTGVGSLQKDMSSAQTLIKQNQEQIELRATKETVNKIDETVQSHTSSIKQNADAIELTVTKKELENLYLGGRNLLKNSKDYSYAKGWVFERSTKLSEMYRDTFIAETSQDWGSIDYKGSDLVNRRVVENGKKYTFSAYARLTENVERDLLFYFSDHTDKHNTSAGKVNGEWKRFSITFTWIEEAVDYPMRFEVQGIDNTGIKLQVAGLKLEEGMLPSDYTPAPEDMDERYLNADKRITDTETRITQAEESIELKAEKKVVTENINNLTTRVEESEAQIEINTEEIKLKATAKDLNAVTGRVEDTEAKLDIHSEAIEQSVRKTELDQTVGKNKWVASMYNMNLGSSQVVPSFDHIKGKKPNSTIEFDDSARLQPFNSDYYMGYYFTNIYVTAAKSVTLTVTNDDGASIFLNGNSVYGKGSTGTAAGTTVFLDLNMGWNTLEVLHYEHAGAESVNLGVAISTKVDKMNSVIGGGDRNISRLTQAETTIKQTSDAIVSKAEKADVYTKSESDNKISSAVTTAKSEIKQTTDGISQTVSTVSTKLDSISIGGTNLIDNTSYENGHANLGPVVGSQVSATSEVIEETSAKSGKALKITRTDSTTNSGGLYMSMNKLPGVGKQFTWSLWVKGSGIWEIGPEQGGIKRVTLTSEWTYITNTFEVNTNSNYQFTFYRVTGQTGGTLYVHSVKLEEGNKATSWQPSINDTKNQISAVDEKTSKVDQKADSIRSDVTSLTTTVNSQGKTITNQGTSIEQLNNSITSKAEKTDVYTKSESDNKISSAVSTAKSEIKQTTDSITQSVTNTNTKIDSINVGSVNILPSSDSKGGWTNNGNISDGFWDDKVRDQVGLPAFRFGNAASTELTFASTPFRIKKSTEYTLSFWYYVGGDNKGIDVFIMEQTEYQASQGKSATNYKLLLNDPTYSNGTWKRKEATFKTTNTTDVTQAFIRIDNNGTNYNTTYVYVAGLKLEEGNKATAWSPSFSDINTQITTVSDKQSKLEQNLDGFKQTVYSKTEADGKLAEAKSEIKQTTNEIVQTVSNTNDKIDNIKIGGRNLARDSKYTELLPKNTGQSADNFNYKPFFVPIVKGEEYTVSFEVEQTAGTDVFDTVTVYEYPGGNTFLVPISNGKGVQTFTAISDTSDRVLIYAGKSGATRGNGAILRNVMIEKSNKPSGWTPAPEDIDSNISNVADAASSEIKQKTDEIKSTVNSLSETVDSQGKTISGQTSSISQLSNAITSKVEKTDVYTKTESDNKISSAVNTAKSEIKQTTDGISQSVTKLQGTVDLQGSTLSNHTSSISQLSNSITSKVEKTDVYTKNESDNKISTAVNSAKTEIQQTTNGITQTVSAVNTKVDNISVGGRNLILFKNLNGIGTGTDLSTYVKTGQVKSVVIGSYDGINFNVPNVKPNTDYTLSYNYRKLSGKLTAFGGHTDPSYVTNKAFVDGKESSVTYSGASSVYVADDDKEHKVVVKFTTPSEVVPTHVIWIQPNRAGTDKVEVEITELTFVEGNQKNSWSPAPEDVDATISTSIATAKSEIKQTTDSITSTVEATNNKIDNLQIGGRNLLIDSTFNNKTWSVSSNYGTLIDPEPDKPNSKIMQFEYTPSIVVNTPIFSPNRFYLTPKEGDKITFSLDFYAFSEATIDPTTIITFRKSDVSSGGSYVPVLSVSMDGYGVKEHDKWVRVSYTYTFSKDTAVNGWYNLGLYLSVGIANSKVKYKYREIKVELGGKATDYTPAPEDVDANISNVVTTVKSEIKQTTDSITQSVTSTNTKIDNISIGGRNLIINSTFVNGSSNWDLEGSGFSVANAESDKSNSKILKYKRTGLSGVSIKSAYSNMFHVEKDEEFTFSVDFKVTDFAEYNYKKPFIVEFHDNSGNRLQYRDVALEDCNITTLDNNKWVRLTFTQKATVSGITRGRIRISLFGNGEVFYREVMVERSNRASSWMPAPEDVDTNISNAVSTAKSEIKQTTDSITSSVTATNTKVNNLQIGGRNLLRDSEVVGVKSNNNSTYPIVSEVKTENGISFTRVQPAPNSSSPTLSLYETIYGSSMSNKKLQGLSVTASLRIRSSVPNINFGIEPLVARDSLRYKFPKSTIKTNGSWQTISCVLDNFPIDILDTDIIRFIPKNDDGNFLNGYLDIRGYQLEVGNVSSDWTKAPEDVEDSINGITVGGRNLVLNSDFSKGTDYWNIGNPGVTTLLNSYFQYKNVIQITSSAGYAEIDQYINNIIPNNEYTFSGNLGGAVKVFFVEYKKDGNTTYTYKDNYHYYPSQAYNEMTPRVSFTFTTQPDTAKLRMVIRIEKKEGETTTSGRATVLKLETGNRASDWTPAPEDIDVSITSAIITAKSEIKQTTDSITSSITATNTKIDNLQIGGRNFIRNGDFSQDFSKGFWTNWGISDSDKTIITINDLAGFKKAAQIKIPGINRGISQSIGTVPAGTYTMSGWYKSTVNDKDYLQAAFTVNGTIHYIPTGKATTSWKRLAASFTLDSDGSINLQVGRGGGDGSTTTLLVTGLKIESGSYATDWTPNTVDVDSNISEAVSTAKSEIKQTTDSITSTVSAVSTKLDNVSVGGRNIVRNGGNFTSTTGWDLNGTSGTLLEAKVVDGMNVIHGKGSIAGTQIPVPFLKPNTEYVASMEIKFADAVSVTDNKPLHFWLGTSSGGSHDAKASTTLLSPSSIPAKIWTKIIVLAKTKSSIPSDTYFRPFVYGLASSTSEFWLKNVQFEEGNICTDWKPSPEDVNSRMDSIEVGGTNYVRNSDLSKVSSNANYAWDKSLNGDIVAENWSLYNGGVEEPTKGYHAHINQTKFGYNVIEFIDKNSQYAYAHRWQGATTQLSTTNLFTKSLEVGRQYTISMDVMSDTKGMFINTGMYHYIKGDAKRSFYGYQWNLQPCETPNVWEKKYQTFTVDNQWDFNQTTSLYVYGSFSPYEGTMWVKNVQVESGNKPSGWSVSPEDVDSQITSLSTQINQTAEEVSINVVKKDNVLTSINASGEGVKIKGDKVDITGQVTFTSLAGDTRGIISNDAQIINANPYFIDWTGTVPAGYGSGELRNGSTMAKVVDSSQKGNVLKFTVPNTGANEAYLNPISSTAYPFYQYVTVQATFKLESGGLDGAGILVRKLANTDANDYFVFAEAVPSPTLNKWYTITKVIKRETEPAGFRGYNIFPMGAWSGFKSGPSPKVIYISETIVRPSTQQEINAYESDRTLSSKASVWDGKETPTGAQQKADAAKNSAISTASSDAANKANQAKNDAISSAASDASSKVNAIKIGGQNILYNSTGNILKANNAADGWQYDIGVEMTDGKNALKISTSTSGELTRPSSRFIVKPNTEYTISYLVKQSSNSVGHDLYLLGGANGTAGTAYDWVKQIATGKISTSFELRQATFTTPSTITSGYIRLDNNGSTDGNVSHVWFSEIMVEEGNKASSWSPSYKDLLTDAQVKADAAESNAKKYTNDNTGNLVNNTTLSGTLEKWTQPSELTVVNKDFQGQTVPVQQIYTDGNVQIYSDFFNADPSKAYEVSLWFMASASTGTDYFGLNAYNAEMSTNIGIDKIASSNGSVVTTADGNPYGWNGNNNPINTWIKRTFYIMPAGTDPADMINMGTNNLYNFRMLSSTKKIRLRYLNFYNSGTAKYLWMANPKVVEVDPTAAISVAKASNAIADMSSDGKITPVEKTQLKKEWATITAEKTTYYNMGTTFGLTSQRDGYNTSYNNLNVLLNSSNGVLANMSTTTAVNGVSFRATFDDYYDKKALLIRAVNERSKTLADSAQGSANNAQNAANNAQNDINNLSIGGRNYYNQKSFAGAGGASASFDDSQGVWNITISSGSTSSWRGIYYTARNAVLRPGRTYTVSFEVYADGVIPLYADVNNQGITTNVGGNDNDVVGKRIFNCPNTIAGKWVKASFTFTMPDTLTQDFYDYSTIGVGNGWTPTANTTIKIKNMKLEEGNRATDWVPSVEDVDGYIASVESTANSAKNAIADMSSDSKITPVEKTQLKKEWATITAEKTTYYNMGTTFGLTSQRDAYNSAFNTLQTDVNSVLSNMSSTTSISGSTFRNKFDDYYDKKAQLIKAVNEKSKSLADNAQGAANNAQSAANNAQSTANTANSTANNTKDKVDNYTLVDKGYITTGDWNTVTSMGVYRVGYGGGLPANFPPGAYAYGTLTVTVSGPSVTQSYATHGSPSLTYTRTKWNSSDWKEWDLSAQLVNDWKMTGKTTINGGQIETDSVTAVQIKANTITSTQIASRTITAGEIKAGTLTTNEIQTGTLRITDLQSSDQSTINNASSNASNAKSYTDAWKASNSTNINGGKIETNTISVKSVNVGDFTNLWPNQNLDPAIGSFGLPAITSDIHNYYSINLQGRDHVAHDLPIHMMAGDEFFITADVFRWKGSKDLRAGFWEKKSDSSYTSTPWHYSVWNEGNISSSTWTTVSWHHKVTSSETYKGCLYFQMEQASSGGDTGFMIQNIKVVRKQQGNMIVDGTIEGKHIKTESLSWEKAKGGTLKLGGNNNENGKLEVYSSDGELIANLDGDQGGFTSLYVADFDSPTVVEYGSNDMNLFVSDRWLNYSGAVDPSDENSGLSWAQPLATMGEALRRIPKYNDGTVVISLPYNGIFYEDIDILGYLGSGSIRISGGSGVRVNGNIRTYKTLNSVYFNDFTLNGTSGSYGNVQFAQSPYIVAENIKVYGNNSERGFDIREGAYSQLVNCEVYNVTDGISGRYGGTVYIENCRGLATSTGIYAVGGTIVGKGTAPSGSKSTQGAVNGGQIPATFTFSGGAASPPPAPETTKTFTTSSGNSWRDSFGGQWYNQGIVAQGMWSSYGIYRGLWFFGTSISDAIKGKTIKSMRIYVSRTSSGGSSAATTCYFKAHNYTSQPSGTPSYTDNNYTTAAFKWGESKWVNIPSSMWGAFTSGTAKGIGIYVNSSNNAYYARFTTNAKIEIKYQ